MPPLDRLASERCMIKGQLELEITRLGSLSDPELPRNFKEFYSRRMRLFFGGPLVAQAF